jgi:hypothetical protein
MLQVMPPNKESVRATAELALDYLSQERYDYVKIVIENVINGLSDPDFGKPHRENPEGTLTVSGGPQITAAPAGLVEMISGKLEFIQGTPDDTWGTKA